MIKSGVHSTILPPVEKTPLLLLRFTSIVSDELFGLVQQKLHEGGLVTLSTKVLAEDKRRVLSLTTTQRALEEQAERIHLMKMTSDTYTVERFTVKERRRFCNLSKPEQHGIFNASEWALLVHRVLDQITVLPPNKDTSHLSLLLHQSFGADIRIRPQQEPGSSDIPSSWKKEYREHGEHSAKLRHVLETFDLVDCITAAPIPQLREEISRQTWWPLSNSDPPVDLIMEYYGWDVAFYFAWMGFLSRWLVFPGILGCVVFLLRWYRDDSIDGDEYTPFYGLVTFVWAILFLRFWQREENRLAYRWGTFSLSLYERHKFLSVRPEFRGYLRTSPVTGQLETHYPAVKRRLKYVGSALVTVAMLVVAFTVMLLSLNLQGYIDPKSNPKRWDEDQPHPFHVALLAALAKQGEVFDASSSWRCFLPVIIHVACISSLNGIYKMAAERLTTWENHETELNHRNSLVLKRFLFEAFDCYVALFYLAFYERDVDRLRMELVAIFQVDTVRRCLLECILPTIMQWNTYRSRRRKIGSKLHALNESAAPGEDTHIFEDLDKEVYDQFDDYMEIVIQLGYVTLFASAYPLASLISIIANWIEIRSDCFKLATVCQRPRPYRTVGLGMWKTLMSSVIWTSALTNCLIAGYTSNQLVAYMPSYYVDVQPGYAEMGHEKGWLIVFLIFGLEKILLISGLLVLAIVPEVPEDLTDELARRHYARLKRMDDVDDDHTKME